MQTLDQFTSKFKKKVGQLWLESYKEQTLAEQLVATVRIACKHGRGRGGDCRKNNVGYELICDQCGGENVCYVGETECYTRALKHISNYKGKVRYSPLWKHAQIKHEGSLDLSYSMKVVKCIRDPLTRQVNEAVRITHCKATTQLNSKTEWHGPATVRLVAEGGGWGWVSQQLASSTKEAITWLT